MNMDGNRSEILKQKNGGINLLILECSNCFSRKITKYVTIESHDYHKEIYQCSRCGKLMDMRQVIVSETEDVMELSNNYWISKDGKKHEFKDMSAEYLKNCIEMLKRSYDVEELKNSTLFIGLTQEYMLR